MKCNFSLSKTVCECFFKKCAFGELNVNDLVLPLAFLSTLVFFEKLNCEFINSSLNSKFLLTTLKSEK